jgi:CheY-like chemotaxis protein
MKTVLFLDDDPYWSQNYRESLQKEFAVVYKSTADGAIAELSTNKDGIDGLIIDVMMDTPDSVDTTETEDGLMTGIWILEKIKSTIIERQLPVVVLTNRQKKLVVDAVQQLEYPKGQVVVYTKAEMSAKQLPSLMLKRISK